MSTLIEIKVPDIGDFDEVDVIEIIVSPGDTVAEEDPLITLESDKASMDIPAPRAGTVKEVLVEVGSKVSEGTPIVKLEVEGEEQSETASEQEPPASTDQPEKQEAAEAEPAGETAKTSPPAAKEEQEPPSRKSENKPVEKAIEASTGQAAPAEQRQSALVDLHAGPAVRKLARELGVDLSKVVGSGRRGRISKEDVEAFVRKQLNRKEPAPAGGFQMPPAPVVDFGKFGEIDVQPMKRIQKLSAKNLHRNWITIPHVTHFDDADITDLEEFRKAHNDGVKEKTDRFTLMPFLFKAVVSGLKAYPMINSSLDADGENLVFKTYFHIGMAVDTENGLLVPVIRDVDKKSLLELTHEMRDLTVRARGGKIKREEMQGGCFTISNLGGIGGTGFTPIVNAPEVAILGVPKASFRPVYHDKQFVPRLILPLSLSYDHRVVDGALAARYLAHVCDRLSDIRKMLV